MNIRSDRQNKKQMGRNVWAAAFVLLLFAAASIVGVGSVIKDISAKEKNVILVSAGAAAKRAAQAGSGVLQETDAQGQPVSDAAFELNVYDKKGRWEIGSRVNLFENAYTDDAGEITVESRNGDSVIAPGTANDYEFSLKNDGNISLDYAMSLDSVFTLREWKLPVELRLSNGGRWIAGGEDKWVSGDALQGIEEKGTIEPNQYTTYMLQWRWPYETGTGETLDWNDFNDTALGNASEDVNFELVITVKAEETPGAVPIEKKDNPLQKWAEERLQPETGDNTDITGYALLLAASGAMLLTIFIWKRRTASGRGSKNEKK